MPIPSPSWPSELIDLTATMYVVEGDRPVSVADVPVVVAVETILPVVGFIRILAVSL